MRGHHVQLWTCATYVVEFHGNQLEDRVATASGHGAAAVEVRLED